MDYDDWDVPVCPCCGGQGSFEGLLGRLIWYICRACGSRFSAGDAFEDARREAAREAWNDAGVD